MKKIEVIKLGTVCYDIATELDGTLTHWVVGMGCQVLYLFQPNGLDGEGQPVNNILLEIERLRYKREDLEKVEIPFEILGTIVKDKASGFTGMAVSFMRHINGCFHVYIQPKGVNAKTNSPIVRNDFDLRSCDGDMIKELNEKALARSKKKNPSPSGKKFMTDYV